MQQVFEWLASGYRGSICRGSVSSNFQKCQFRKQKLRSEKSMDVLPSIFLLKSWFHLRPGDAVCIIASQLSSDVEKKVDLCWTNGSWIILGKIARYKRHNHPVKMRCQPQDNSAFPCFLIIIFFPPQRPGIPRNSGLSIDFVHKTTVK